MHVQSNICKTHTKDNGNHMYLYGMMIKQIITQPMMDLLWPLNLLSKVFVKDATACSSISGGKLFGKIDSKLLLSSVDFHFDRETLARRISNELLYNHLSTVIDRP